VLLSASTAFTLARPSSIAPLRRRPGNAGPRHHAQQIFARAFRLEAFADAEPQDLRQIVVEMRRRTQDFRRRWRQHAEPRGVVQHLQRIDVENVGFFGGVHELPRLLQRLEADIVLVTIPDAPRERLDEIVDACAAAGVDCRFVRREIDLDPRVELGTVAGE